MSAITSLSRTKAGQHTSVISRVSSAVVEAPCEMDSHADTCVLGRNFRLLHYTGRVCDVTAYTDEYTPEKDIPIVTAATIYQSEMTGELYLLIVNEGLWFGGRMHCSLLNPNKIRHNGNDVHDNPYDQSRPLAITVYSDNQEEPIHIPMSFHGTILKWNTRTPTNDELDTLPHYHLSSPHEWNPHSIRLSSTESTHVDHIEQSVQDITDAIEPLDTISCI
jgi:hypothetical protein